MSGALINTLINKQTFYELCDQYGIDHPGTFIYRREMGHDFTLDFQPPTSASPPTGWPIGSTLSRGMKRCSPAPDRKSLEEVLDKVYAAGYPDTMIIQDFIPGDDSYMRVLTNYSDRNGKVKLMCMGHVLLEEHTPPRHRQPRGDPHRALRGDRGEDPGLFGGHRLCGLLQL